jgi:hypothetical protein
MKNATIGFVLGAYACGAMFCYGTAKDNLDFGGEPEWAKRSLAALLAILWPLGFAIMTCQMFKDFVATKIRDRRERLRQEWIERMIFQTQKR